MSAFLQGLQEWGWAVGRNVQIEYRWAAGDAERIRKYATELIALAPDVILAAGGAVVEPLLQATSTVPIVFAQTPIRSGPASSPAWRGRARRHESGRETLVPENRLGADVKT